MDKPREEVPGEPMESDFSEVQARGKHIYVRILTSSCFRDEKLRNQIYECTSAHERAHVQENGITISYQPNIFRARQIQSKK